MDILQVSKLLLEHYMEIPDQTSLKRLLEAWDPSGMTALLVAVDLRDYALIELLIGAGADVKVVDDNGNSALIRATTNLSEDECYPPEVLLSPTLLKVI